jgi:formylglycine-generating enzyme required for sulfatase activity
MVWVPPTVPGQGALFIDRYEVTIAQVEAVAGDDEVLRTVVADSRSAPGAGPNTPAWFFSAAAVTAYERVSGRSAPEVDQWLQAAFGPYGVADHPYPWGAGPPDPSRCFAPEPKASAPAAVGGRAAGASHCGAEDMVGNLAEWVRKGGRFWFLGGHHDMGLDGLATFDGRQPARDPQPGKEAYDAMGEKDRNDYFKYKIDPEQVAYVIGLRMVVPVPLNR